MLGSQINANLEKIWSEIILLDANDTVELLMDPTEEKNIMNSVINKIRSPKKKRVAFVYDKDPSVSDWIYGHELGRLHLEESLGDEIATKAYITDDVDEDGIIELPNPIPMHAANDQQYLIRWYALDIDGRQINKLHTYHNYVGGWYLELDSVWAPRVSVVQEGSTYTFYLWDEANVSAQGLFSVHCFTGSSRETQAAEDGRFPLLVTEKEVFAAALSDTALELGITEENLIILHSP